MYGSSAVFFFFFFVKWRSASSWMRWKIASQKVRLSSKRWKMRIFLKENRTVKWPEYSTMRAKHLVWLWIVGCTCLNQKKQEHNSCRMFKLEMEWNRFDLLRRCTSRFSFLRYFRHHYLILYQHYFRSFLIIWSFKKRKELIPWETNSYKQLLFKEKVKKRVNKFLKN